MLVLTCLAATACSRTDGAAHRPKGASSIVRRESTTTAEPITTIPPTTEQQVKTAYLAAVATYFEAARNPDPNNPALARTRSGPSLKRTREILARYASERLRAEFVADAAPIPRITRIEVISPNLTIVSACIVDNVRQIGAKDGVVVNDAVVSRSSRTEMRFSNGAWRFYFQDVLRTWDDGLGCDR